MRNPGDAYRFGGRRNRRWQDSCNPLFILLQVVTRPVAGVYAVWVNSRF